MEEQLKQKAIDDILAAGQQKICHIPTACQSCSINPEDNRCIHNENMNWLTERTDMLPIWSRLKQTNCLGQNRNLECTMKRQYDIEIPNRLYSIFGTPSHNTKVNEKMLGMEKYQLLCCCLALCTALKYNLNDWSPRLLDGISTWGADLYGEHLKKLKITNDEFNIKNVNNLYHFDNTYFRVHSQQVATGFLYIRYGLNEFNLARALNWFFRLYQFGVINCYNRTIAFGFNVDEENGFFMYDCQSKGYPLFEVNQINSYLLRTNHLQVLLYCLIISLNVTMDRTKFYIYNVDVRIEDPQETKKLKKKVYEPAIIYSTVKVDEKRIDNGKNIPTCSVSKKSIPKSIDDRISKSVEIDRKLAAGVDKALPAGVDKALPAGADKTQPTGNDEKLPNGDQSIAINVPFKRLSHVKEDIQNLKETTTKTKENQEIEKKPFTQSQRLKKTPPLAPPKPKSKLKETNLEKDPNTNTNAKNKEEISSNHLRYNVYLVDNRLTSNSLTMKPKKVKVVNQLKDLL